MKWSAIEIDPVNPICLLKIDDEKELKVEFNWKSTQPLSKQIHQQGELNLIF